MRTIDTIKDLSGKTVLLRIDSDVDIEDGRILDDTRLAASLPTIEFLLKKGAGVNIVGHLGRPEGEDKKFTLEPIANWFAKKFKVHPFDKLRASSSKFKVGNYEGWKISDKVNLIENIRFYEGEEKNDQEFARELALLGDIYVNEAFAVSHREHASIVGITKFSPSYAGLHLQKEVEALSKILNNPKRPLAVLIAGAKIETKLPLVEKMHRVAEYVLVGGEIAEQTRVLIKVQHEKIPGNKSMVLVADLTENGLDITPKSVENFKQVLRTAATIVWNGPVGLIRPTTDNKQLTTNNDSELGTRELAHFIVSTKAYKVVGGGDTLAYLRRINLLSKFDFVSTGGGAMLEFLSGNILPGIAALEK